MILEGIVTTVDPEGAVNVAPMGPLFESGELLRPAQFVLKPFKSARTYRNLVVCPTGVFHVVDDVLLLAQAAVGVAKPQLTPACKVAAPRLTDCCRFHEFRVAKSDVSADRTILYAEVLHTETVRDFAGLCRAKHAVVEAAILATRLHLLPRGDIELALSRLLPLVEKTGGAREREAFDLLTNHIARVERVSEAQSPPGR